MVRVLLVNPSSRGFYEGSQVEEAVPFQPCLSMAMLSSSLKKYGHDVKILDFNLKTVDEEVLVSTVKEFKPEYVGFTFVTPLFHIVQRLTCIVKKIDKKIKVVCGGPHSSSIPQRVLEESDVDIVVIGEGDIIILEIINNISNLKNVKGICFKQEKKIILNPRRELIPNLDVLPFPDWEAFDLRMYNKSSRLVSRKSPLGFIETSRGCVFDCCFCNKSLVGRTFRAKSAKRVVAEMEYMLRKGFQEIYVVDDGFTTDMGRASEVCKTIMKKNLMFPWTLTSGVRVDRVTQELFEELKMAGCYRVAFGIESGNEAVLKDFGKHIKLDQVRRAVNWATKAGLETLGFFMLALPADTESSMQDTIDFAKQLDLSVAKFTITIPYPGTKLFNDYDAKKLIKSKDWKNYDVYKPNELFNHPTLEWDTIYKYHKKAFRSFYFRPKYIIKRFVNSSIKQRTLVTDIKSFFSIKW